LLREITFISPSKHENNNNTIYNIYTDFYTPLRGFSGATMAPPSRSFPGTKRKMRLKYMIAVAPRILAVCPVAPPAVG
jgi:hypothetical protein